MKYLFLILSFLTVLAATAQDKVPYKQLSGVQRVYNVLDYGAVGDGTTECTSAIQAAIQAAYDAGGGIVYFPIGIYKLGGALQTSVNATNPNCQLYVPLTASTGIQAAPTIKLLGESAPSWQISGLVDWPNSDKGVILYSSITGSGTTPSVIGTPTSHLTFGDFNFTGLDIENIVIRTKSKSGSTDIAPTVGGINAGHLETFTARNIKVETESDLWNSVVPTAAIYGIICPQVNNNAFTRLENCSVQHMYYAYSLAEHTVADNINAWCSVVGFAFQTSYHAAHIGRGLAAWCNYNVGVYGTTALDIDELAIEDYNNSFGTKWYANTNDVLISGGGSAIGRIIYHRVVSNVGMANGGFSQSGTATGLLTQAINSTPTSQWTAYTYGLQYSGNVSGSNIIAINNSSGLQSSLAFQKSGTTTWQFGSDFAANNTKDFYIYDQTNAKVRMYVDASGNIGFGNTANTAPYFKIGSTGTLIASQYGSGTLYSNAGTLATTGNATAALDFPSTAAQTSSELTIAVTGAVVGDAVALGTPASIAANGSFTAYVSTAGVVTVRFNNYSAAAIDPASGTFKVAIVK